MRNNKILVSLVWRKIIFSLRNKNKVGVCVFINDTMEVNNGNKSDSLKKIEKQRNPKVMNLLL